MFATPATLTEAAAAETAQVFAARWPATAQKCNGRMERAIRIACTPGTIQPADRPGLYVIQSESNPLGHYVVDVAAHACTCPDHGKHAADGIICKHRLAVALVAGLIAPQPDPAEAARQAAEAAAKAAREAELQRLWSDYYKLRKISDDAWLDQLSAANHFESLIPRQLDLDPAVIDRCRARVIELTEAAHKAQEAYRAAFEQYAAATNA